MRKLLWFTIGFAAACGGCVWQLVREDFTAMAVLAVVISFILGLVGRRFPGAAVAAMVLAGFGSSLLWYGAYSARYLEPAMKLDGEVQTAVIRASDYSFDTGYGIGVDGIIQINGKSYPIIAYLDDGVDLSPGDILQGDFRFRITVPGGKQETTSHAGKGIFLLAYQKKEVEISRGTGTTFREWASVLRKNIENALESCLAEDVSPFAKALLLGDVTDLSYETDTYLKVSGIRHVAAVSGLHVSILFALAMNLAFRQRFLSAGIGIPMLLVFAAVAGFTPSVNRACVMSALMLLALVVKREYDGFSALSASVLIMLATNPLAITSVSLHLSAVSVAGIFLFSGPISGWLKAHLGNMVGKSLAVRLKRWLVGSVATSLSAMVLTVPMSAMYFGTVSLISVVTNLLTLWIISLIFYGLMAVCLLHFLSESAAVILGKGVAVLIRFVLNTAKLLSEIPIASVYTVSVYISVWLIFVYILLAVFMISREKRPLLFGCCGTIGLCLALICSWVEPMLYDTSITVLDVGQGQCILLQSEGRNYLVDCGGDDDGMAADAAAALLLSQGISKLDGLILTHMDRDHAGGAANLLNRVDAQMVIMPPVWSEMAETKENRIFADRQLDIRWGNTELHIFGERTLESDNENSLCILLDTKKCDILITGDRNREGEIRLLQSAEIPQVDVLIAGHHGSKYASSQELLDAVQPEIVCISAGADNIYGHPAVEALERFAQFDCQVYRTDLHGTITIRR